MQRELVLQKAKEIKELRKTLGEKEFKERFVGDYKGHISKIKKAFNNAHKKFTYKNTNQVDKVIIAQIMSSKIA